MNLPKIEKWERRIAWITSGILGAAIVITAVLTLLDKPLFDDYMLLALVITVFPSAVLDYLNYRWKTSVDEHLPDLFRSIVQAQETGVPLPQALEDASKRDYGPLTGELKKMVTQMSWGMPFEEAFQTFGRRVDTTLTRRTVPLVVEASKSGGRIERVFGPLGRFIQMNILADKEQRAQTRPYIAIVYVAFFIFLITITLLFKTFFVQMVELPIIGFSSLNPEITKRIFFHMTVIQGLFGGLVAGKMGEDTISAGLKHSVILLTCGYVVFKLIL